KVCGRGLAEMKSVSAVSASLPCLTITCSIRVAKADKANTAEMISTSATLIGQRLPWRIPSKLQAVSLRSNPFDALLTRLRQLTCIHAKDALAALSKLHIVCHQH